MTLPSLIGHAAMFVAVFVGMLELLTLAGAP